MELLKIIAEALRGASIVMILVSFFLCNCGILQADWGYFNNDIAFGPLGGPICYHNNTEDVQKCKDAFRVSSTCLLGVQTLSKKWKCYRRGPDPVAKNVPFCIQEGTKVPQNTSLI
uniref:Secreted protein n=1 Tax=Bursaphelenchus xylophilus TaxID=6326 RepID=A0A1I7SNX8_BURXY